MWGFASTGADHHLQSLTVGERGERLVAGALGVEAEVLERLLHARLRERLRQEPSRGSLLLVLLVNKLGVAHVQNGIPLDPGVRLQRLVHPLHLVDVLLRLGVLLAVHDGLRDDLRRTLCLAFLGV